MIVHYEIDHNLLMTVGLSVSILTYTLIGLLIARLIISKYEIFDRTGQGIIITGSAIFWILTPTIFWMWLILQIVSYIAIPKKYR